MWSVEIVKYWDRQILKIRNIEIIKHWNYEILKSLNIGIIKYWNYETFKLEDNDIIKRRSCKLLQSWNIEIVKYWSYELLPNRKEYLHRLQRRVEKLWSIEEYLHTFLLEEINIKIEEKRTQLLS